MVARGAQSIARCTVELERQGVSLHSIARCVSPTPGAELERQYDPSSKYTMGVELERQYDPSSKLA